MDLALDRAIALFQQNPIYWAGVILWLLGFAAYVPACCGRGRLVLSQTGIVLCWLGFAVTLLAYFVLDGRYRVPTFERPTLDSAYWLRSDTQIWLLWIAGSALLVASGLHWLTARAGWLGLATAMVGVIASWPAEEGSRHAIITVGAFSVATLFVVVTWRGEPRRRRVEPGDYEAELISLCGASRRADRLIRDELKRNPSLSRAGAALAAVTRLRHARDPYPLRACVALAHLWMVNQRLRAVVDALHCSCSSGRIILRDVLEDIFEPMQRLVRPD